MLQCGVVGGSVLQCVVGGSVLQCVVVCCSGVQYVAVAVLCCSVWQCVRT